jgi:hypothetical protein
MGVMYLDVTDEFVGTLEAPVPLARLPMELTRPQVSNLASSMAVQA